MAWSMTTIREPGKPNSTSSPPQSPPQENPKMTPQIPEDVIFNHILPRIPAKFLVRFKLVSRQWNSFLSYPNTHFFNTHLSLSSTSNSRSDVLTHYSCGTDHLAYMAIDYDNDDDNNNLEITQFGTNLKDRIPLYLLSSCNGLGFLISVHDNRLKCKCEVEVDNCSCNCNCEEFLIKLPDYLHDFEFHYLVCNPFLGSDSFVEIEHPHDQIHLASNSFDEFYCYNFGFGYVSSLNDYYIVVVTLPKCSSRSEVVVYVYSFRSLKWGILRKFSQNQLPLKFENFWHHGSGTLVKETLHWAVTVGDDKKRIAAFDLGAQDEFKLMQLPDHLDFGGTHNRSESFSLCCMNDCLCALGRHENGRLVELWMLKEYGVHLSWTKLFCFYVSCFDEDFYFGHCFGFYEAGVVLIHDLTNCELVVADITCDPPENTHIKVKRIWGAVNYFPSLVSPLAIISEQSTHNK